MRFNKQVALTGDAPICPIELSDLVVGLNHLGWSPLSHDRFMLRKLSPLFWPVWLLVQNLLHVAARPSRRTKRQFNVRYWLEAEINESGDGRTLAVHGRVPLSERRKLDALLEALSQGRRWLSREGPLG
jgi:hypothetical protein